MHIEKVHQMMYNMWKSYYACATCDMIRSGENGKLTSKEL